MQSVGLLRAVPPSAFFKRGIIGAYSRYIFIFSLFLMSCSENNATHLADGPEKSRLFVLAVVDQRSGQPLRVLTDEEITYVESLCLTNDFPPQGCFNCGIVKTPQWRKGPPTAWGPAKLCNACGTKYLRNMRKKGHTIVQNPSIEKSKLHNEYILV